MTVVHFGDSSWPVHFGLGALRQLGRKLAPTDSSLEWMADALAALTNGDVRALVYVLWAGMGCERSGYTPVEVEDLLDAADPGDTEPLRDELLSAIIEALPEKNEAVPRDSGNPWDWNVAYAVWTTEWGQPAAEFWKTTLREFGALSDGRALLYASAQEDGPAEPRKVDVEELKLNGPRLGR